MRDVCDCGDEFRWAISVANGRRSPFNLEPEPEGDHLLVAAEDGLPIAVPLAAITDDRIGLLRLRRPRLFRSHFATCPNADRHRKGNRPDGT